MSRKRQESRNGMLVGSAAAVGAYLALHNGAGHAAPAAAVADVLSVLTIVCRSKRAGAWPSMREMRPGRKGCAGRLLSVQIQAKAT